MGEEAEQARHDLEAREETLKYVEEEVRLIHSEALRRGRASAGSLVASPSLPRSLSLPPCGAAARAQVAS